MDCRLAIDISGSFEAEGLELKESENGNQTVLSNISQGSSHERATQRNGGID
jgi:hypothetical protein